MRGKAPGTPGTILCDGITPAYAGKSFCIPSRLLPDRDHPRVCGEKCIPLTRGHGRQGSPPRMRGKVQLGEIDLQDIWITPAYAGKSGPCPDRVPPAGDHPRVCGEKAYSLVINGSEWGSPPRMRGKVRTGCADLTACGITPAYAGKSTRPFSSGHENGDHPRVCGEKAYSLVINGSEWGSPPRMRGKVTGSARAPLNARITPAYAGKSLTIQKMTTRSRDHPRVCGEKSRPAFARS